MTYYSVHDSLNDVFMFLLLLKMFQRRAMVIKTSFYKKPNRKNEENLNFSKIKNDIIFTASNLCPI